MDGCWFRPPRAIALATDVVKVRLDLPEAFEFPIGGRRGTGEGDLGTWRYKQAASQL
jgi:hypothetical protein